jgi:N-acetylglucosamine kinase-like BadF-type ATPase
MSRYFLGVDGGQSSTVALIGDEACRVVGMGRAGPSNHVEAGDGRAKFIKAVGECLEAACTRAELDPSRIAFASACLGFSGGPADKEALVSEILRSERTLVTDDARIALSGALAGEPGIIVIAGTGSIAFGRNAAGESARAGGWGYIYGDEGGAFYIVKQALRAALRLEEGWGFGASSVLRSSLLDATGAGSANELMHRLYTTEFSRSRTAELAKLVDAAAAAAGDAVATEILQDAADQLEILASTVRSQLFETEDEVRVAYQGGVFSSHLLLESFRELVEGAAPNRVLAPVYGPAAGALLEAYRAVGISLKLSDVPPEKT